MTATEYQSFMLASRALLVALEERDRHTGWHMNRVATLAERLAGELGLPEGEVRQARAAGLLHDIGKVAIPDAILFKPGPLTLAESLEMRAHAVIGERILLASQLPVLAGIAPIVRHHHERIDGSGYPDGLRGAEIPRLAQIVSIVDAYEAMASDRPYRPSQGHVRIMTMLAAEVTVKWAPALFAALERVFAKDPLLIDTQGLFARSRDEH